MVKVMPRRGAVSLGQRSHSTTQVRVEELPKGRWLVEEEVGYTDLSAPPEHRIRCSIIFVWDGSHGRPAHLRPTPDPMIWAPRNDGDNEISLIRPSFHPFRHAVQHPPSTTGETRRPIQPATATASSSVTDHEPAPAEPIAPSCSHDRSWRPTSPPPSASFDRSPPAHDPAFPPTAPSPISPPITDLHHAQKPTTCSSTMLHASSDQPHSSVRKLQPDHSRRRATRANPSAVLVYSNPSPHPIQRPTRSHGPPRPTSDLAATMHQMAHLHPKQHPASNRRSTPIFPPCSTAHGSNPTTRKSSSNNNFKWPKAAAHDAMLQ
ncbi:hypothetical protein ACLOJK_022615 [Asimina triloba]